MKNSIIILSILLSFNVMADSSNSNGHGGSTGVSGPTNTVPEPGTLLLIGLGAVAFVFINKKK